MLDDDGDRITDPQILDRVADIGAMVVQRQPVEATDVATWRRELRRAARTRGMRIRMGGAGKQGDFLVDNPDHVVDPARLRAAVDAVTLSPGLGIGPRP